MCFPSCVTLVCSLSQISVCRVYEQKFVEFGSVKSLGLRQLVRDSTEVNMMRVEWLGHICMRCDSATERFIVRYLKRRNTRGGSGDAIWGHRHALRALWRLELYTNFVIKHTLDCSGDRVSHLCALQIAYDLLKRKHRQRG